MEKLKSMAQWIGIELSPMQLSLFSWYARELRTWNMRVNLTRITDPLHVELRHFADSLTVALALPGEASFHGSVVDVGSGPGFPGLPLKLALPEICLSLVESSSKKAAFLDHIVGGLNLEGVTICRTRAEELAHQPAYREQADVAVARAVGHLATISELCLPFCRLGGTFIAQKGETGVKEVAEAEYALSCLGGKLKKILPIPDPQFGGGVLVVVEKIGTTPLVYPRRSGIPRTKPLLARTTQ